mmetsp:Transcript_12215/g.18316  ORF Transcript_12215/g.18316 Transcript_12215/m.18316 type:complete len:780 (+) Transcript_12215:39-2378(+)
MAGAIDLVISELVVLSLACLFLIRYYKGHMVTADVTATVYASWVMGFVGVLLLPYDLSVALVDSYQSLTLINVWKITYWSTFFLAWVVLPIQMEYHSSGHFNFRNKLKDSFVKLFLSGLMAFAAGIVYLIFMFSTGGGSLTQIIGFTMAMSNTYGVLLITVLMGSGLVGIPKRLWIMADSNRELQRLYISAATIEDEYQEARYELEDTELEVFKLAEHVEKAGTSSQVYKEISANVFMLKTFVANFQFASRSTTRGGVQRTMTASTETNRIDSLGLTYTEKDVVNLHARLIKAQLKARSAERRWRVSIQQAKKSLVLQNDAKVSDDVETNWCTMQTEMSGSGSGKGCLDSLMGKERLNGCLRCCSSWLNAANIFWMSYCRSHVLRAAAVICGVASCLILWSEMLMASNLRSPMSMMMGDPSHLNPIIVQAVSFLFLSYMSICTYWTLFRINISWEYKLQGPQQSPPSSLIFNAEYFSRLQFALGYNFLLCLNVDNTSKTAFNELMHNTETVPVFGASFTVYVPLIMVLVALITLFDGLARLLKFIGVETEDSLDLNGCCCSGVTKQGLLSVEDEEKIRLGKSIITSEIKQEAINLLHWQSSSSSSSRNKDIIMNRPPVTSNKIDDLNTKGKVGVSLLPMACGSGQVKSHSSTGIATVVNPHRNKNYENIRSEEKLDDIDDIAIDFHNYMNRSPVFSPVKSTDSDFDEDNHSNINLSFSSDHLQSSNRNQWGFDGRNRMNSSLFGVISPSNARNGQKQTASLGDFHLDEDIVTGGRYSDI